MPSNNCFARISKRHFNSDFPRVFIFVSIFLLGLMSSAAEAQSTAFLVGNPQVTSGLRAQGYTIQPTVSQTASSTTITYNVTPPTNPTSTGQIGRINWELLSPSPANVTFTITWTGLLYVNGQWSGGSFLGGNQNGSGGPTSPQTITKTIGAGTGYFLITLRTGQSGSASLSIGVNVGSPNGARLPYLNDFAGTGFTPFTVWRPSGPYEGYWFDDTNNNNQTTVQWGLTGDVPVPGDYDGDGISDRAIWRPSEGNWYVLLSSTGAEVITQWGLPGDIPIAGADFDGDGKTDYAVWRPSDGSWYVRLSSTGAEAITQWGWPGDIPVVGNFDGDAKTDYAVWRPSEGNWYVLLSSTNTGMITQWGLDGDIPVPGDYDRDGKTDYAVWRPSEGNWYVSLSGSNGQLQVSQFGMMGDVPVPGQYDGDGYTDIAVWRPSTGTWYTPALGTSGPLQWGLDGDFALGQTLLAAPAVMTSASEPAIFSVLFPLPAVQPFQK